MKPNDSITHSDLTPLASLQKLGQEGEAVCVGIIDGAIDASHPLLQHASITVNETKLTPATLKTPVCGAGNHYGPSYEAGHGTIHGTAVCSLIAGFGLGIAPKVSIYSFPVFKEKQQGQIQGCSERTLSKAIDQAREAGCDIINISGASPSVNGLGSSDLRKAIERCEKEGVLVVAATGNEGRATESLPASLDSVLAVGACNDIGAPAIFNNAGAKLRKKTLLASGVDMPAATPGCELTQLTGSSFAAPVVSAISALLINILALPRRGKGTPECIQRLLFETSTQIASGGNARVSPPHYRLNLSSLLKRVQKDFSAQSTTEKRSITMSNTEVEETPEIEFADEASAIEAVTDEIAEFDLQPSALNNTAVEVVPASSLRLPEIQDSASHKHVHVIPAQVRPSSNTDGRTARELEKVFLIGTIGYDFGTEARLDYFTQVMGHNKGHPFDPVEMAKHLIKDDNIEQSNSLIWTLKIDGIPVYAIDPDSQFAVLQFGRLVEFLSDQETKGVERVSIAGVVTGETRLFNGQVIPKISPVLRGMFNWTSNALAELVMGGAAPPASATGGQTEQLTNFLNRVYYELRNRGTESQERAINYAATNAYQMKEIFDDAFKENLFLNKISASESPVCRPDSDCWDVILEFFNPKERLTAARKLYRYTVDVSDVMPVTIGQLRSWHAY